MVSFRGNIPVIVVVGLDDASILSSSAMDEDQSLSGENFGSEDCFRSEHVVRLKEVHNPNIPITKIPDEVKALRRKARRRRSTGDGSRGSLDTLDLSSCRRHKENQSFSSGDRTCVTSLLVEEDASILSSSPMDEDQSLSGDISHSVEYIICLKEVHKPNIPISKIPDELRALRKRARRRRSSGEGSKGSLDTLDLSNCRRHKENQPFSSADRTPVPTLFAHEGSAKHSNLDFVSDQRAGSLLRDATARGALSIDSNHHSQVHGRQTSATSENPAYRH
jgi:hypothetical protein